MNLNGSVHNSWDTSPLNGTMYLYTSQKGNYCLTFDNEDSYKISVEDGIFNFNKLIASPNSSCKFDVKVYSNGYLKYVGEIWINGNKTNYTVNYNLTPNLDVVVTQPDGKEVNGSIYVNGNEYQLRNGEVQIPNKKDIVWIYIQIDGYEKYDEFFNVDPYSPNQTKINITLYLTPKPNVSFNQNISKTNLGQAFSVNTKFENPDKSSAEVNIFGNINGCGLNKEFNFNLTGGSEKEIKYTVNPTSPGNCTISLFYKIQTQNSLIKQDTLEITHYVSDKYNVTYQIVGNEIVAEVYDVNGNPVDTNLSIVYNGTTIKFTKESDGKYYATIPGNEFKIVASDGKNTGGAVISGNFIKSQKIESTKNSLIGWGIIGALSAVTVGWIYYSRKLK